MKDRVHIYKIVNDQDCNSLGDPDRLTIVAA